MSETLVKIPLTRLRPAADNVRKIGRDADIAALAASIEAHGLLQNLTVQPVPSGNGRGKDYEVVAGGRRLRALKLLARRKRIPKRFGVPCRVLKKNDAGGIEVSLAENFERTDLHPADQFEAFSKLQADGLGAAEIAARFGVTPKVVEQRLKLAAVSSKLMAVYKEGGMTLDQLTAFTVSDDHALQEHVWFEAPLFDRSPSAFRRALTKTLVDGSDRRARFVGIEAYEAAGGTVNRDLFDVDAAYFTDSQLLDRLAAEKLQVETDKLRAEGWNWVEARIEPDYEELGRYGRVSSKQVKLPRKEEKRLKALSDRHDKLVSELDDQPDAATVAELDRMEAEIDALSAKREQWSKKDKARAGTIVSLDSQGVIRIMRGLVRSDARERPVRHKTAERTKARASEEGRSGYADALIRNLSAHRTAALRESLAVQPDVALTAVVHTLVLCTFFAADGNCLGLRPVFVDLAPHAEGIEESPAVAAMAERHRLWAEQLPEPEELWDWLTGQTQDTRLELLAYLAARTVNAVRLRHAADGRERLMQADRLAKAVSLDMAKWWRPTRASYFDRVSKQHILQAVSEAVSPRTAEGISAVKKGVMAVKAEELLRESNWLPGPLRTAIEPNASDLETSTSAQG